MSPLRSAAGAARHYNLRLPTEGLRRLTPDSRAPAEGVLCSPRLAVCSPKLADVTRMLPQVGPM